MEKIYLVRKQSHETKLNELADLEHTNPKAFRKSVTRMLPLSENYINGITHSKWVELNTDASGNINPQFLEYVTSALPQLEGESSIDIELKYNITREELRKTIKMWNQERRRGRHFKRH